MHLFAWLCKTFSLFPPHCFHTSAAHTWMISLQRGAAGWSTRVPKIRDACANYSTKDSVPDTHPDIKERLWCAALAISQPLVLVFSNSDRKEGQSTVTSPMEMTSSRYRATRVLNSWTICVKWKRKKTTKMLFHRWPGSVNATKRTCDKILVIAGDAKQHYIQQYQGCFFNYFTWLSNAKEQTFATESQGLLLSPCAH